MPIDVARSGNAEAVLRAQRCSTFDVLSANDTAMSAAPPPPPRTLTSRPQGAQESLSDARARFMSSNTPDSLSRALDSLREIACAYANGMSTAARKQLKQELISIGLHKFHAVRTKCSASSEQIGCRGDELNASNCNCNWTPAVAHSFGALLRAIGGEPSSSNRPRHQKRIGSQHGQCPAKLEHSQAARSRAEHGRAPTRQQARLVRVQPGQRHRGGRSGGCSKWQRREASYLGAHGSESRFESRSTRVGAHYRPTSKEKLCRLGLDKSKHHHRI